MKKIFSLLTLYVLGLVVLSSCNKENGVVNPQSDNSLKGRIWTVDEGSMTSTFEFLNDKDVQVTETYVLSSDPGTRAETTTNYIYNGTYTYDKNAGTAELNYNNRSRQFTDIHFGEGSVSCKIDGVNVTITETVTPEPDPNPDPIVLDDKKFLDATAREFVGMFNASQTANYASIYNVIKESEGGEAAEKIEDIIDGLTTKTEGTNLTIYKYAIKAAAFKGRYILSNGKWDMVSSDGHYALFHDDKGRQCELKVTMSGSTKKVIVYEENEYYWGYSEQDIYEAEIPSHIECVLTQGGSQLVKIVADFDLSSITAGQKVNLSRNSLSFKCTADLRDVAKITTDARYNAQGTSTVNIIVEKNGKKILTADASSQSKFKTEAPEDWNDDDFETVSNTTLNLNILDKVQIKGTCRNISSLIEALDEADSFDNRYNYNAVKRNVDSANENLKANVYYNKVSTVRASLRLDVDYKESYSYDGSRTKYYPVASICFKDGSSYFMEDYFTEDAFKVLLDMIDDLTDKVEDQFE